MVPGTHISFGVNPIVYGLLLSLLVFQTGLSVAQAGFDSLLIVLPQPPECWDSRQKHPCLAVSTILKYDIYL